MGIVHKLNTRNKLRIMQQCLNRGIQYETVDSCMFYYSLVKMKKPKLVLELGTGNGSTAFMIGLAMIENSRGEVITIDNGKDWIGMGEYEKAIRWFTKHYKLEKHVDFRCEDIDLEKIKVDKIDMVISDFDRSAKFNLSLIIWWLYNANEYSSLFIDSLSENFDAYSHVKETIDYFNRGIVPGNLPKNLWPLVQGYKFTQTDIRKCRNMIEHNSITWIKKEPHFIGVEKLYYE